MFRARRSAFTLVELLVVIGIIAVLIAILMPALTKAREQANRVKCAANLHNWGIAAHAFAAENKGRFPMAFHHSWFGMIFPSVLNWDEQNHSGGPFDSKPPSERWKYYGSTIEVLLRYGIQQGSLPIPGGPGTATYTEGSSVSGSNLVCPSADAPVVSWNYSDSAWGTTFWSHYMYVGGLGLENINPNWPSGSSTTSAFANWGKMAPAQKQGDKNGSGRVLAADEVFFAGPGSNFVGIGGGLSYRINHRQPGNPKRPDFQNILFGDGHVEGFGKDYYTADLDINNWSACHDATRAAFYWNGTGPNSTSGPPPQGF